jgi:hypothetical protein
MQVRVVSIQRIVPPAGYTQAWRLLTRPWPPAPADQPVLAATFGWLGGPPPPELEEGAIIEIRRVGEQRPATDAAVVEGYQVLEHGDPASLVICEVRGDGSLVALAPTDALMAVAAELGVGRFPVSAFAAAASASAPDPEMTAAIHKSNQG